MKYRTMTIGGMALALTLGTALAAEHAESTEGAASSDEQMESSEDVASAEQELNRLDADSNGELSEEEVAGTDLESQFTTLDADADGVISAEEFEAGYGIGGPATGTGGVEDPGADAGSESRMPETEHQEEVLDPQE